MMNDEQDNNTPPVPSDGAFLALGLDPALVAAVTALGYEEPTDIQREAIPPLIAGRDVLGQAATGTGKTFTLENLVVELVLSTDLTIDRLLCVTFTEKATHEIRARVRGKLQALLSGRGEPAREAQIQAGDAWILDDRAIKRLEAALHAFDASTIATIHAF